MSSIFQNSGCVNTVLGSLNQLSAFLPLAYRIDLTTTLNRKYDVLSDLQPTTVPKLMYFGIGINGYTCATSTGSFPQHIKRLPDGRNMDLYCPIPFRMVTLDHDLPIEERRKYRMRAIKSIRINDDTYVDYVCYYLKTIDWDTDNVDIIRVNPDGTEDNYTFDDSFLRPTPPETPETGGELTSNDRVIVRAIGRCTVTPDELKEAMSILYGTNYCTVSEFGFYTGYDVYVDESETYMANVDEIDDNDPTVDHTKYENANIEAAYVQLAKHKTQMPVTLDGANSELETLISFEASNSISI